MSIFMASHFNKVFYFLRHSSLVISGDASKINRTATRKNGTVRSIVKYPPTFEVSCTGKGVILRYYYSLYDVQHSCNC